MKTGFIHQISRLLLRAGRTPKEFRRHVAFLKRLIREGHLLETVLDIGANQGDWSAAVKAGALRGSYFVLIEPNQRFLGSLSAIGEAVSAVLSNDSRTVKFYSNGGTGDSYYLEQSGHYSEQHATNVQTVRLDQLPEVPHTVDVIKIDTQGSEIDILNGFGDRLSLCKVVIAEVSIYQYNLGAPLISEFIEFMNRKGFSAVEILDEHFYSGRLFAVDIAFLNHTELQAIEQNKASSD